MSAEPDQPPPNVAFGARLRAIRKENGWTLRFLAAKAGVHWTYLGQVERGERNVSLLTILRLAKALGTDAGALLRGLKPGDSKEAEVSAPDSPRGSGDALSC